MSSRSIGGATRDRAKMVLTQFLQKHESVGMEKGSRKLYLIIDRTKVDIGFHWFTGDATRKHVLAGIIEAVLDQDTRHVLHLKRDMLSWTNQENLTRRTLDPPNAVPY